MNNLGPLGVHAGIVERFPHQIDLMLRDRPGITAYQLWGASSVDDAYGNLATSGVGGTGGTNFILINQGASFRSPGPTSRGHGMIDESRRGMSRIFFDPDDYVDPALPSPMPSDDEFLYIRVQEAAQVVPGLRVVTGAINIGLPVQGPILVIPPYNFYATDHPSLQITGTAPSSTLCAAGSIPNVDETMQVPLPMHIVLPVACACVVNNQDGGGNELLVSSGMGSQMIPVPDGEQIDFMGVTREIVLARTAGAGGCSFTLRAAVTER